ncbi:hypothetical protein PybrP1_010564 [[Pythium] brassicae (nom. inval.)]|nr:hypothetical protein PybrP1_010564 [[Pythium] brassicae (nom. inval.)]
MWKPGASKPAPVEASVADAGAAKEPPAEPRPTAKAALSQKTLAMKFMQRKQQAEARRQSAALERKQQDEWTVAAPEEDALDGAGTDAIVCVADVADPSLPLIFGRRSFGGFNKGVEDEYREASRRQRFAASEEKELRDEVSAEEMTERMIKYTGLMRGKASGQRPQKRQRK